MQTMITFQGGQIDLDTFNHENMHQWWGDSVTEANYNLTFFKEGMATLRRVPVRRPQRGDRRGRPGHAGWCGRVRREPGRSVQHRITPTTGSGPPPRPTRRRPPCSPAASPTPVLARPTSRCARSSARTNFTSALQQIQRDYRHSSITEKQLEAEFQALLPNQSAACSARLDQFFTQWFDTAYPPGGGANRPQLTGPGLNGPGFYNPDGTCG